MSERRHRRAVARLVWLLHHDEDSEAWMLAANRAGYKLDRQGRERHVEWRLSFDGAVVATIHEFPDEAFAFVFVPEARSPWYLRAWWRLTHPFTVHEPLPWPRRETSA
jgi:hypothetical protein